MEEAAQPCGGGGFLGCRNAGTELIVVADGGALGHLCPECTERLENDMRRRMADNVKRYHRLEPADSATPG